MNKQGLIMCSCYAVSPNALGYCGPNETENLRQHLKENLADREVNHILSEFETMYPYLQLIARENKVKDPFNYKVVEAYWLGNHLLTNVSKSDYLSFLKEKIFLEKKVVKKDYQKIKEKLFRYPFLPHHTFHVFNIFKKMNKDITLTTLTAMDECRINYGKIIKISKIQNKNYLIEVKSKKLIFNKNKLKEEICNRQLRIDFGGQKFIYNLRIGDWVSFHWGQVCDKINENQAKNLNYYTQQAINFFNQK